TVVYKLNMVNGQISDTNPILVYWIRYAEKGQVKELSSIQKKLAYGIKSRKLDQNKHELNFVSYPDLKLLLMRSGKNHTYQVHANIDKQQMILHRIFVRTSKNGVGWPNVVYIELIGNS